MGKRHITARITEGTASALDQWAEAHGTGRSEAIERLLVAGLSASHEAVGGRRSDASSVMDQMPTADDNETPEASQEAVGAATTAEVDGLRTIIEVLRESNTDLRAEVSTLTAQLVIKDQQIEAAHGLADHAQRLHAADVQKALPAEGQTRGGWFSSIFRRR